MQSTVAIVARDAPHRSLLAHVVLGAHDMRLAGAADDLAHGRALLDREHPDVLLLDLDLAGDSGLTLIRHAAATLPCCEVMVVTVFDDERHIAEAIAAGATGYLLKQDAHDGELAARIRALRAGGSPISPAIARRLLSRFVTPPIPVALPAAGEGAARDAPAAPRLSVQEQKVLQSTSRGHTYDETAHTLGVSRQTVLTYVKRTYRKLQVRNKLGALHEARRLGLLDTARS